MKNKTIEKIVNNLEKGEKQSPFLFISKNIELVNENVWQIAIELCKKYKIPYVYIYKYIDSEEKIKIKEIKSFLETSNTKPPYKFQIFIIENISRLTLSAWNSLLKFFEETDKTNIIFLTNKSEWWVLDTILSRVQVNNLWFYQKTKKDDFYISLINNYIKNKSSELLIYFFKNKLEKQDYIKFLENLIIYISENKVFLTYAEKINSDIDSIKQNNVNAKYIVDKWLLNI